MHELNQNVLCMSQMIKVIQYHSAVFVGQHAFVSILSPQKPLIGTRVKAPGKTYL